MDAASAAFDKSKEKILSALATPDADYTDLSPKGSVDEGIRDLINDINRMPGIVTTSSCAGRLSVFLEGSKWDKDSITDKEVEGPTSQAAVPGGKGLGGRWLFVSHEPVTHHLDPERESLLKLFGMLGQVSEMASLDLRKTRFVKLQFEPMILHIMAASLRHAQPILSAAINAGFRESGVQSLKNLDDLSSFPMVAVRSSGLALASLVGFINEDSGAVQSIVDEGYLKILLNIANERFGANAERIQRFRTNLLQRSKMKKTPWETKN
ncbi:MAG: hypothetical protein Q9187_003463, partial [Circinaria calcarea]